MARGSDFLGPYRLVKLIRSGQHSQVWEAIHDKENQRIAVKVLLMDQVKNKDAIDALKHEAEVGKTLESRYVIRIYEFNSSHVRPFVAMQLFNAKNLKQMLRESPEIVAYYASDIIRRCAKGIDYLHQQNWVHCDIKPDNFLLNTDTEVKLIDFSIAQRPKKGGGLAGLFGGKGKVRGTRSYMSPEQIRGKALTASADIYGFGCMVYELLAGKPPFSGTSPDELLRRHLNSPPPTVQAQNHGVTTEFAEFVQRLMAKSTDKRPVSMNEVLTELSSIRVYRAGMRPPIPQ